MTTGRGCLRDLCRPLRSRCRLASFIAPVRNRVNEFLILMSVGARCHSQRLAHNPGFRTARFLVELNRYRQTTGQGVRPSFADAVSRPGSASPSWLSCQHLVVNDLVLGLGSSPTCQTRLARSRRPCGSLRCVLGLTYNLLDPREHLVKLHASGIPLRSVSPVPYRRVQHPAIGERHMLRASQSPSDLLYE